MEVREHEVTSGSVGNGSVGFIDSVIIVVESGKVVVVAVNYRAWNISDFSDIKTVHALELVVYCFDPKLL